MIWMQGKLKFHKHVDFASNWVPIDILILIEKQMIGVDVLHEHLIALLFSSLLVLTLIVLNYI